MHPSARAVRKLLPLALLLALLFPPLPGFGATDIDNFLLAGGCPSEYFLMQELTAAYNNRDKMVIISKTGNAIGLRMLLNKKLDIAFLSMPHDLLAKKIAIPEESYHDIRSIEIAAEPILMVVDPKAQITELSKEEIIAIYNGDIRNWQEVGGADLEITACSLNHQAQSGLWAAFKRVTIGMGKEFSGHLKEIQDPALTNLFLHRTRGGIAYIGYSSFDHTAGTVITVDGREPTVDNFANGSYPFVARYYLSFFNGNPQVDTFIDFVQGPEGQAIVNRLMMAPDKSLAARLP